MLGAVTTRLTDRERATPMPSPLFDSMKSFKIGKYTLKSRLFVGTGKYPTLEIMRDALEASGCQVVTVAVRRVEMGQKNAEGILDYIDPKKYIILPNTAGCFTAQDAVRSARLAREGLGVDWV